MLGDATEPEHFWCAAERLERRAWRVCVEIDLGLGAKLLCFSRAHLQWSLLSKAVQGIPFWARSSYTSPCLARVPPRLN